jgi:hypothetical protein
LTLNDDESILYFADRVLGIHKLDIAPDEITKIQSNKYISPIGIDGLYYYNNALIAIHNGVNPFKIVQYLLDVESANVIGQKYINRAGPSLGQPTLGQIKDGYFYYISNSLRDAYDADGKLQFEKVPALQIRRFRLN